MNAGAARSVSGAVPLVVFTDFTTASLGLYGQRTALVTCWVECDGCGCKVSRVEVGGGDWEKGLVVADAAIRGCRWTTGQKPDPRTSRPYCPACQRRITPGPYRWSDGSAFFLPPAPLPALSNSTS